MSAFIFETKGRIAYLTLNRPEAYNAMNRELWGGLIKAWTEVGDNPDIWVGILTGAGNKAFCSGQDLKEMAEWMAIPEDQRPALPLPAVNPMNDMQIWKPMICAVNGVCIGGGLELALACDIRIAADTARLGLAEVKSGVIPGNTGSQKLPRLISLWPRLRQWPTRFVRTAPWLSGR